MKTLDNIPESERRHYIKCPNCGDYICMFDLEDVFYHEGDCITGKGKPPIDYTGARRAGECTEYLHGNSTIPVENN